MKHKMCRNPGIAFDVGLIKLASVNLPAVEDSVTNLSVKYGNGKEAQIAFLLRAVTCLDLTTLCGDDTISNVQRLCFKAASPIQKDLLQHLGIDPKEISVAAVCVYPSRVGDAVKSLIAVGSTIPTAAVAAGFPSGQYHLKTRLDEIQCAIDDGAREIDIVIDRDLALRGEWQALYKIVKQMKDICGKEISLKAIVAAGELGSLTNVYKASMMCMMAGVDFIKTSTGKEGVNATLPIGMVMTRAIKDYFDATGFKVGFKPAGGIRSVKDVLLWQMLMKKQLGNEWLHSNLFRIGASALLGDIEKHIYHYVTGCYASNHIFPYL